MAVPTHEGRYYLPLAVPAGIVSAIALDRLTTPSRRASRFFAGVGLLFAMLPIALASVPAFGLGARLSLAAVGAVAFVAIQLLDRLELRHRVAAALLVAALCGWSVETWANRPYRLRLLRRVHHPWRLFLLYRVEPG